eukprot:Sspe_Gene.84398::Locus_55404_Transcript_2_9_Confidence_0.167_Length_1526::g.84398::m.84398
MMRESVGEVVQSLQARVGELAELAGKMKRMKMSDVGRGVVQLTNLVVELQDGVTAIQKHVDLFPALPQNISGRMPKRRVTIKSPRSTKSASLSSFADRIQEKERDERSSSEGSLSNTPLPPTAASPNHVTTTALPEPSVLARVIPAVLSTFAHLTTSEGVALVLSGKPIQLIHPATPHPALLAHLLEAAAPVVQTGVHSNLSKCHITSPGGDLLISNVTSIALPSQQGCLQVFNSANPLGAQAEAMLVLGGSILSCLLDVFPDDLTTLIQREAPAVARAAIPRNNHTFPVTPVSIFRSSRPGRPAPAFNEQRAIFKISDAVELMMDTQALHENMEAVLDEHLSRVQKAEHRAADLDRKLEQALQEAATVRSRLAHLQCEAVKKENEARSSSLGKSHRTLPASPERSGSYSDGSQAFKFFTKELESIGTEEARQMLQGPRRTFLFSALPVDPNSSSNMLFAKPPPQRRGSARPRRR